MSDSSKPHEQHGSPPGVDPSGSAQLPAVMSIEELRAHIHEIHDASIGSDDPVLMLHTMHQVFMNEYEHLLKRHNQAITSIIGTAIKGLTEEALAENILEQVRLADRNQQLFEKQFSRMKFLSALNGLFTIVCILTLYVLFTQ